MDRDEQLIANAYVTLLRLSHGMRRHKLHSVLIALRDDIAEHNKVDEESVQTAFEQFAAKPAPLMPVYSMAPKP